jgi:uncharacterized membrane protein YfcA
MIDLLPHLPTILACAGAMLLAGMVKGVIALGLPLVGLPLLMLSVDVQTAITLLMVPLVLSNLLQALQGEGTAALLRRFWPIMLALGVGTFAGIALFASLERHVLLLAIGILAIVFSTASLLQPNLVVPPAAESWLGPAVGLLAGVVGGMSTLFGPPLAIYVVGLRLPRDTFVKVISILYTTASGFLLLGGVTRGVAEPGDLLLSLLAMIPVYAGMLIGQRIRRYIDPERFRLMVLGIVWLTGANLIRTGLGW